MDLEDNETAMDTFDSQVEELKGTIESLEAQVAQNQTQMSDMEARLEESKAQVKPPSYTKLILLHWRRVSIHNCIKLDLLSGLCLGNPVRGGPVSELLVGDTVCHS